MMETGSMSEDRQAEERANRISKRQAEEQITHRAEYFDEFSSESLLWMALPPGWTLELAKACNFPPHKDDIDKIFERMVIARIAEISRPISVETLKPMPTVYTLKKSIRFEVLGEYKDRLELLRATLVKIGQHLLTVADKANPQAPDLQLFPPTRRWALLAITVQNLPDFISTFDRYTADAFQKDDSAEILNWIETGRRLATILAHDLDSPINIALQQASRRLELLHRRKQDEWQLQNFLERPEQVEAFEALMGPDHMHWALHYIGAGALGKTMLLRHITTRKDAVVARIDFDYLNADYPRRSPGLLLWSFAQELRAYDRGTRANKKFDDADKVLRKLQQYLQSGRQGVRQLTIQDPEFRSQFQEGLALYIDALQALSRPVILILDTCEELARTRPEGTPLEDVEETFKILRALHDGPETLDNPQASSTEGLPSLRVIFAGRRPLAKQGYKWHCPSSSLPKRPYLRLHQIRGFPYDEAGRYLRETLKVSEYLIPAVIQQSSPDGGDSVPIEWKDKADQPPEIPRCNPYILRLYADWARETPPPSLEDLANATDDKYVELRIIGRLRNDMLVQLLPAVALLRHFDKEMLVATSGADAEGFDKLFEQLREQEWISQRWVTVRDGRETLPVLDLEPGIQKRLLDYFSRRGSDLRQAKLRAADYLKMITLQRDLATLNWSVFDAALRVLASNPESATIWWEEVNSHILTKRDFSWALRLTSFLLGADGAVGARDDRSDREPENPLRLNVLATYAAAILHSDAATRVASVWDEIAQKAKDHPVPTTRAKLQLRALAGSIAAHGYTQVGLQPTDVQVFWQEIERLVASPLDAQIAAALVAATEAIVEYAEELVTTNPSDINSLLLPSLLQGQVPGPPEVSGPVRLAALLYANVFDKAEGQSQQLSTTAIKGLQAFAATLAARALAIMREYTQALDWFQRALTSFQEKDIVDMSTLWADWLPPDNLAARVRLEFIRAMYPAHLSAQETRSIVGIWQGSPATVDADRLHSALLRLRQAEGTIAIGDMMPEPQAEEEFFKETDFIPGPATCNAHEKIPALFATTAETLALHGHVDVALPRLRFISQQVNRFAVDTVQHAERALIGIIKRMRLRDEHESGGNSLLVSSLLSDQILLLTLNGLSGTRSQNFIFYSSETLDEILHKFIPIQILPMADELYKRAALHAIWQTSYTRDTDTVVNYLRLADTYIAPYLTLASPQDPTIDFQLASLYLDICEASLLSETYHTPLSMNRSSAQFFNPYMWWQAHLDQPIEALTLWLRFLALLPSPYPATFEVHPMLLNRVGIRQTAEIALNESELLGRRLPEQALVIQEQAIRWFDACSDAIGSLLAGIARSLILARQHQMQELGVELNKIAFLYAQVVQRIQQEAARKQITTFPTWEHLLNLSLTPDYSDIGALGPRSWRPWLVRLVACLMHNNQIRDRNEELLRVWLTNHYGATIGNSVELPPDFVGWFTPPSTDHLSWAGRDITDVPGMSNAPEQASVSLGLNIIPIRSAPNRYQSSSIIQEVELNLEERVPKRGVYVGSCKTTGLAPYRKMAEGLPGELYVELRDLWRRIMESHDRTVDVAIQTASDLVGPCWEAMIALTIQNQSTPDTIRFRFQRVTTAHRTPRPPTTASTLQLLSCAGNEIGQSVAQSGWQALTNRPGTFVEVKSPNRLLKPPAPLTDITVLHLIGIAEASTAGIRFRFTGMQSYIRDSAQSFSLSYDPNQSDTQIRAVDIARLLPNLALCIIQGDINQELIGEAIALRGESERRDAILARTFAAELYEQGIPAVLVIPSLAPSAGMRVLERLSSILLVQPQPTKKGFIDALTEVQASILNMDGSPSSSWIEAEREARWELALDACLYVSD